MKSFTEYINEFTIQHDGNEISLTKPSRASNESIVKIKNLKLFDSNFKKTDMYIGKHGTGQIKNRYKPIVTGKQIGRAHV